MRFFQKFRYDFYTLLSLPFWYLLCAKLFYNSDFALGYVAGKDFLHGNILLKHWAIGNDSFFTTDLLWQALLYALTRNMLVSAHLFSVICIGLLYLLLWRVLCLLMGEQSEDWQDRGYPLPEIFFLLCSLAFLAMRAWIFFTPGRGMTIAFCLLAVIFYYRPAYSKRSRFAVILFATLAMSGDKYAWAYLALPLCALWLLDLLRNQKCDRQIACIIVAIAMTCALRLFLALSGFSVPGFYTPLAFADFSRLPYNLYCYAGSLFQLFSAWFWGERLSGIATYRHLAFAAFLILLLASYFPAASSRFALARFLALSAACVSAPCLILNLALQDEFNLSRYQTGIIINALPLCAWLAWKHLPSLPGGRFLKWSAVCIALAITAFSAIWLPANPKIAQAQELATTLAARGHKAGYGQFWAATSTSFYGEGRPEVFPVNSDGRSFRRYYWMTRKQGFSDRQATFIVHDKSVADSHFDAETVEKTFGKPAEHLRVGDYEAWLYDYPLNKYLLD